MTDAAQVTNAQDRDRHFLDAVRPEAANAPASGIVEVFNYGHGRQGLMPLWVGEGDRGYSSSRIGG